MLGTFFRRIPVDQYIVLGIIALFVLIAALQLGKPGVHYDEALYLNAAQGVVDNTTFVTKTFHGFPVLLMPYIGALKAWVFYPIFAVFDVSAVTMRLPSLLLTGAALWLLYMILRNRVGRTLGIAAVACTALCASFIVFTRLDFGPVVLDLLLKVLGLGLLLRFAATPRMRWLGLFWLVMLLGVFNKLNFIWYVDAFSAAFVIMYGKRIWKTSTRALRRRFLLLSAGGFAACIAYYLYITVSYHLEGNFGFVGFALLYENLSTLISGSWFYNYAFSTQSIGSVVSFWIMTAVIAGGVYCLVRRIKQSRKAFDEQARFTAFIGLLLVLVLGQVAMTLKATAGWHYFSIYPFFGICFVLAAWYLAQTIWPARRRLAQTAVAVAVGLSCIYQIFVYAGYIKIYSQPLFNRSWSTGMYDLIDFTKKQHRPIVVLDWGMQTQLIGFDPVPYKYYEVFGPWMLDDPVTNDWLVRTYFTGLPDAYYIGYAKGVNIVPQTQGDFFKLAAQHGYTVHKVTTILGNGEPLYTVYRVTH